MIPIRPNIRGHGHNIKAWLTAGDIEDINALIKDGTLARSGLDSAHKEITFGMLVMVGIRETQRAFGPKEGK